MRLVVLGNPVDHSLSPSLHNAALDAAGLEGEYGRRNVDEAGMKLAVGEIRSGVLAGASVTMPHKELAYRLSDRRTATAERAQAVNTLVSANGVVGHNTDVVGIQAAWEEAGLSSDGPALVLGAGGAAAAALLAVEGREIFVAARRREAADALIGRVGVAATVVEWGAPVSGSVVVNATPVGMQGESLDERVIGDASGVFDMAYGPAETPAVSAARRIGIPVADGQMMLLHQAAAAFELWTGHPAPLAAMRAPLDASHTNVP